MNVESFAEMMNGAVITHSMNVGSQHTADNTALPLNHADPVINASEYLGVPGASQGVAAMRLVGGTDFPGIPDLNKVAGLATESHQAGLPLTGIAQGLNGPEGHSHS